MPRSFCTVCRARIAKGSRCSRHTVPSPSSRCWHERGAAAVRAQVLERDRACVICGVPRIHAAQPLFQTIVEQDLRDSISDGLGELVRRRVSTAGTPPRSRATCWTRRKAITIAQSNGYNPTVLAIDPSGAKSLGLLKSSGTEAFYVFNAGAAAPAPYGLEVRIWKASGTAALDANNFGRLFVSPLKLRFFEADAGTTNGQNVRLEANAGFTVERVAAALRIL